MEIIYFRKNVKWKLYESTLFDSKHKEDRVIHTWIGVDAEFQSKINKNNQFLTVQLNDLVLEHPSLGLNLEPSWDTECAISYALGLKDELVTEKTDPNTRKLIVHLGMFYSPADLVALFRSKEIAEQILAKLEQDKRIKHKDKKGNGVSTGLKVISSSGFERHLYIHIHDAAALFGNISLKELAETLGCSMDTKDLLTKEDKERMADTYVHKHEDFINYSRGDSLIIQLLFSSYEELWGNIYKDMEVDPFMPNYTVGSTVAKLISRILARNLANRSRSDSPEIISRFNKLKWLDKEITDFEELISTINREATAKDLALDTKLTSQFLAMVDGGRCKNERPRDINAKGLLADLDISGCYGNGLLNQIYPVGIPTVWKFRKDLKSEKPTLEWMLNKHGKELVPGLWYARVSTVEPLSFDQDVLLSKIPPDKITKDCTDDLEPDESEEILGTFVLLTREVKCAALNHDLLQILKDSASDKEWSELKRKLVIESLIFYPASMECKTTDEWVDKLNKSDKGVKNWIGKNFSVNEKDERSRHWIGIPMNEEWMDKILGLRKNYPSTDPKNKGYKLIGNSTYGVLASIYFDIGNVVVANNITARARALAWMMAKALGSYQSITDGGVFNLNTVNSWKDTKPGLNTLANINERHKLARQTADRLLTIPLGGHEWKFVDIDESGKTVLERNGELVKGNKENWQLINDLAWEHISKFFPGDIDILRKDGILITGYDKDTKIVITETVNGQFSFTTKDVYIEASFQSQANYRLVPPNPNDEINIKARGYEIQKQLYLDTDGENKSEIIPIKDCLERIAKNEDIPPYPPVYNSVILKINAWSSHPNELIKQNNLLPGDSTTRRSHLKPISLTMFRWRTWKQFQMWDKRHDHYRKDKGYGVELYFLNPDKSVRYSEAVKDIQDAIDVGKNWISDIDQPPENEHPYR